MDMSLKIILIELYCMAGAVGLCVYCAAYRRWYSWNLYQRAYKKYKLYLSEHNYTYESYRDEFIYEHENLKLRGERRIRLYILLNLLQNGRPLIEKYFEKEQFTKKDYKNLVNESRVYINSEASNRGFNGSANDTPPFCKNKGRKKKVENRKLKDIINLEGQLKDELFLRIQLEIPEENEKSIKGQAIGLLYIALSELKYINTTSLSPITPAQFLYIIRNEFGYLKFAPSGFNNYSDRKNLKNNPNATQLLENLKNRLNLNK